MEGHPGGLGVGPRGPGGGLKVKDGFFSPLNLRRAPEDLLRDPQDDPPIEILSSWTPRGSQGSVLNGARRKGAALVLVAASGALMAVGQFHVAVCGVFSEGLSVR